MMIGYDFHATLLFGENTQNEPDNKESDSKVREDTICECPYWVKIHDIAVTSNYSELGPCGPV